MKPTLETKLFSRARALMASVIAFAVVALAPALSFAQEFVKVEGKASEDIPAGPFVGIAYGFIWIAILAYVVFVARGVARVRGEVDELRRKLDAAKR